MATQEEKH
jgi:hypothetical protein